MSTMSSFETVLAQLDEEAKRERALQLQAKQKLQKSATVAYVLAFSLGMFGAHHFYLGRPLFGVAYLLTLGLCGVGYIVDLFRIGSLVEEANDFTEDLDDEVDTKTNVDAYILWFPCGILGFHHFYLENYVLGIVYLCTFGVYGLGWIVDFFRIPSLVSIYNTPLENVPKKKSQTTAYLFALSPFGVLGLHHYYLNRWKWGLLYTVTCGVFGVGWLVDLFRVPYLIHRENRHLRGEGLGLVHTDDVYLLWFSFGLFGVHHYYLGRKGWALLYLCTFGMFTIGWLFDVFRIPCLVLTQNNHNCDNDIDDVKCSGQVDFLPAIYEKTVEYEHTPERKIVIETTLDPGHFAIMKKPHVKSNTQPKQYENSFFQPLESPIHRRSLSSSNLAGKLGPKRAPSVRTAKTKVQSISSSSRNSCEGPEDDDVVITKVVTTPRGTSTHTSLPSTPRDGGKTTFDEYNDMDDELSLNSPRSETEIKMPLKPRNCTESDTLRRGTEIKNPVVSRDRVQLETSLHETKEKVPITPNSGIETSTQRQELKVKKSIKSSNATTPMATKETRKNTHNGMTINTANNDDVEHRCIDLTTRKKDRHSIFPKSCLGDITNESLDPREIPRADDEVVKKIVITPRDTQNKVKSPRFNDVGITTIGSSPRIDDEELKRMRRGPVWDGRGADIRETCGGLSPREVTQWMSWRDDDIIL
ncbi:uncharacterized protein [Argopecten irradians]|uniref:uncharacterized protein n=1 Tax=Argopecten irradians TaxID=31199 RepID=UPI00371B7469